jgi:hypothetical protein
MYIRHLVIMSTQSSKSLKQCISELYFNAIQELFNQIEQTDLNKQTDKLSNILFIGVNSIHRVFEYVLLRKKNIEKATYYARQACYYFVEYMEQIHTSNLTNNLNNTDAVMFVYKKTIFEMHDGDDSSSSNTMDNILTMTNDLLNINDEEWRSMYSRILQIVNVIFYWNNHTYSFKERKVICDELLLRYLYAVDKLDFATAYLDNIQHNFEPNYDTYMNLLNIMITKSEKMRRVRSGSVTDQEKNERLLNKFSANRDLLKEKYETGNMVELVNWLYTNE